MKTYTIETGNLEETQKLGEQLGSHAEENMVFLMKGIIGAGKTTMTQGIARGMGVRRTVSSPTFTIQKIYHGTSMDLYHIDAYRLEGIEQDLGFEDDFENGGLTVIEWSEFFPGILPEEYLSIEIRPTGDTAREIVLEAHGAAYEALLEEIQ
ncbi:MAG: tRNA (adenosine(37)-N6)-threonylcarbamoyltransferase complex ATPase subunit type 1 TsaE [Erysipelotrichaceae bacterium]|nr:tRNA (adenosine(37)-N6)-threonylcarbamoyltransferase complex ATPase subunit type 1 TsaE [Erysipelotrichaceae bacterium]